GGFVRGIPAWQERTRIVHHRNPNWNVPNADAVVDQSPWFAVAVPAVDISRADFELDGARDAVEYLASAGFVGLLVRMEIDERRRNNESGGVDLLPAGERPFGDRRDFSGANSDAAHGIESGFGIDHASADDDEVVVLRCQRDDRDQGKREQCGG